MSSATAKALLESVGRKSSGVSVLTEMADKMAGGAKTGEGKVIELKRKFGKFWSRWELNPGPPECETSTHPNTTTAQCLQLTKGAPSECAVAFGLETCVRDTY